MSDLTPVDAAMAEVDFRLGCETAFRKVTPEEAAAVINRATASVAREPSAFGLDAWPQDLPWQEVAAEIRGQWLPEDY